MAIYTVRRLAADLMRVGENKIRIRPEDVQRASEALTRGDVANLIKDGAIYKSKMIGKRKKEKRSRRGQASRRGRSTATKNEWMSRIRSQRKYLRELFAQNLIDKSNKRSIYMRIKSGMLKNKRAMLAYLKENSMLKGEPAQKAKRKTEGKIKQTKKPDVAKAAKTADAKPTAGAKE